MVDLFSIALAVASTVVAAFGILLFKLSAALELRKMLFNKSFILGCILFLFGGFFLITAMKSEELSLIFPITSLTYIWVMLLSKIFLKENINRWKLTSIAFIIIGIILVTYF